MNDREQRCAHPACHCQVRSGEPYCSEYCRKRVETPLSDDAAECRCGHAACTADAVLQPGH